MTQYATYSAITSLQDSIWASCRLQPPTVDSPRRHRREKESSKPHSPSDPSANQTCGHRGRAYNACHARKRFDAGWLDHAVDRTNKQSTHVDNLFHHAAAAENYVRHRSGRTGGEVAVAWRMVGRKSVKSISSVHTEPPVTTAGPRCDQGHVHSRVIG